MAIARTSLRLIPLAAILLSAGCAVQQPSAGSGTPSAGHTNASESAAASPAGSQSAEAGVDATTGAEALAPVPYAAITALTAGSVSWIDAKLVPAQVNNVKIELLEGAAHKHSAPLSPDVRFFLPMDAEGVFHNDSHGNGTVPCDRAAFAEYTIGNDEVAPRLTFDAQGRVATMAARYHP